MKKTNHIIKTILHPIMLLGVKLIDCSKVTIIGKNPIDNLTESAIFVVNHTNGHDFPVAAQVIKKHFYILADFTMKKDFIVNTLNRLNGCVYVDRKNPTSKKQSKEKLIKHLKCGNNVLLFPEGTWNLHPSRLLLPLNWGAVDLSLKTGKPIIPIVLLYRDKSVYVKIGTPFKSTQDKTVEIMSLEEQMSTLLWDLMMQFESQKRADLPTDYKEKYIKEQLDTYKKFNLEYETSVIRK